MYVKAVKDDIHQLPDHGPSNHLHDNLTSQERKALLSLRSRTDIIKPAEKGSATVVIARQDYLAKVMSHLEKKNFYRKLDEDPMERFAKEVMSFLQNTTNKQTINQEFSTASRHKNHRPPDFTSYQRSIRM